MTTTNPEWVKKEFKIEATPLSGLLNTMSSKLEEAIEATDVLADVTQLPFIAANEAYLDLKKQVYKQGQEITNEINTGVQGLINTLMFGNPAPVSFIVGEPIFGNLDNVRNSILKIIGSKNKLFKNINSTTHMSMIVMLVSGNVNNYLSFDNLYNFIHLMFGGKFVADSIDNMYKNPADSPLAQLFLHNPVVRERLQKIQQQALFDEKNPDGLLSTITNLEAMWEKTVPKEDALKAFAKSIKTAMGDAVDFFLDTIGKATFDSIKNLILKGEEVHRKAIEELFIQSIEPVDTLEPEKLYIVDSDNPYIMFKVRYPKVLDETVAKFDRYFQIVTSGDEIRTLKQSYFDNAFGFGKVDATKFDILFGTGQIRPQRKLSTSEMLAELKKPDRPQGGNILESALKWVENNIPAEIRQGIQEITDVLKNVDLKEVRQIIDGGLDEIANQIPGQLDKLIGDAGLGNIINSENINTTIGVMKFMPKMFSFLGTQIEKLKDFVDTLNIEKLLNFGSISMLKIPYKDGGLDRIRRLINEYVREGVPNAPIYDEDGAHIPVIIWSTINGALDGIDNLFQTVEED